ncbi:hypothetical protein [uncultured Fibrobacter sp.]|uniref:hypothetical protein n=1 Tax=uncultured Fibrobacter sp. TaxID=261512 RepID=UPI00156567F5|nr:hypothetical protein [uncultured Fibrobacter sp.]
MFSYFRTRRSVYFNIAFLFVLAVVWLVSYMQPVLRSFFKEEHVFYGRVSYAAIPSLFGGSNIPFLDKTFFQLNGDAGATFVLYASREMNETMSEWFSFSARNVEDIPIEVSAVRISDSKFIVKSIATTDAEMDWDTISEYQLYYSLVGLGIVLFSLAGAFTFLILGIKSKR